MDRIIILILGVASLFGCKSSSLSSKADVKKVENVVEKDSAVINTDKTIDWREVINSDVAIVVEEVHYDTDKEVDSETKLPPVKSKKVIRVDNKEVKESSSNTIEAINDTSVRDIKKDIVTEDKTTIKESVNKESPLKHIKSILWALIVLAILLVGYKLYRKFSV